MTLLHPLMHLSTGEWIGVKLCCSGRDILLCELRAGVSNYWWVKGAIEYYFIWGDNCTLWMISMIKSLSYYQKHSWSIWWLGISVYHNTYAMRTFSNCLSSLSAWCSEDKLDFSWPILCHKLFRNVTKGLWVWQQTYCESHVSLDGQEQKHLFTFWVWAC